MKIFNRRETRESRRELRKNTTLAERRLWGCIKNKSLLGLTFRRQHGIGAFIVDFYIPKVKLVIEIDGDSHFHADAREYDARRTLFLKKFGITVMRFTNVDIDESLDGVYTRIVQEVRRLLIAPPPTPSPQGGEGELRF